MESTLDVLVTLQCRLLENHHGRRGTRISERRLVRLRAAEDRDPCARVRPQKDVVDHFKAAFPDARVIGDAARAGRIIDATQDAYGQAFVFEA